MLSISEIVIYSYFIRDSDIETLLLAVRSGIRIPAGMNFSHLQTVQTITGTHAASYDMDSGGVFRRAYTGRGVKSIWCRD